MVKSRPLYYYKMYQCAFGITFTCVVYINNIDVLFGGNQWWKVKIGLLLYFIVWMRGRIHISNMENKF